MSLISSLSALSLSDSLTVLSYVIYFGMFFRFGSRWADFIIETFKNFFSHFKKDR